MFTKSKIDNPIGVIGWDMYSIHDPKGYIVCFTLGERDTNNLLAILNKGE